MDKQFLIEIPELVLDFTKSLKDKNQYSFEPANTGLTKYGKAIKLGFSCYALKIYYMTGEVENLDKKELFQWSNYIKSFHNTDNEFFKGYFIDPQYIQYYKKTVSQESFNSFIKTLLNIVTSKNYELKQSKLLKGINAETKQALATLNEINQTGDISIDLNYKSFKELQNYLDSLDWSKPWAAGAQFSSFCVYSQILELDFKDNLVKYIKNLVDHETGSYFSSSPTHSREIINGAMKVITGLDWLEQDIHFPEKLIDFCISNKPVLEGCDVVDYIYVLYKCSQQVNYRKKEINNLFISLIPEILRLYIKGDNAFSYFIGKSQTHYYGVPITKGYETADIHGSLLCLWGILMILDNLEMFNLKHNIIKP